MSIQATKPEELIKPNPLFTEFRKYHEKTFELLGNPNAYYLGKLFYVLNGTKRAISFFESELKTFTEANLTEIYLEPVGKKDNKEKGYILENIYDKNEPSTRPLFLYKHTRNWETILKRLEPNSSGNRTSYIKYEVLLTDLTPISQVLEEKRKERDLEERIQKAENGTYVPDKKQNVDESKQEQLTANNFTFKKKDEVKTVIDANTDLKIDAKINEMTIRDLAAILLKRPVSNKEWLNEIVNLSR